MHVFNTATEQQFDAQRHLERTLASIAGGDVSLACWEPGQTSPYHCHPAATEIYLRCEGGGVMRTPGRSVDVTPGSIIVHPPGEVHEYTNGTRRTLLFRVRYGQDMRSRTIAWPAHPAWEQSREDAEYFRRHPLTPTV